MAAAVASELAAGGMVCDTSIGRLHFSLNCRHLTVVTAVPDTTTAYSVNHTQSVGQTPHPVIAHTMHRAADSRVLLLCLIYEPVAGSTNRRSHNSNHVSRSAQIITMQCMTHLCAGWTVPVITWQQAQLSSKQNPNISPRHASGMLAAHTLNVVHSPR